MNDGLEGVVAADTVLSHTDGDTGTISPDRRNDGRIGPSPPAPMSAKTAAPKAPEHRPDE